MPKIFLNNATTIPWADLLVIGKFQWANNTIWSLYVRGAPEAVQRFIVYHNPVILELKLLVLWLRYATRATAAETPTNAGTTTRARFHRC